MLITSTSVATIRPTDRRARLWPSAVVSGLVAAAATTTVAAIAHEFGSPPAISGKEIPLYAFAQLTLIGALLGAVIAKVLSARLQHPRRAFVRTAMVLAAMSIIPDLVVDTTIGARLTLVFTHAVASAIIVPALARRLAR